MAGGNWSTLVAYLRQRTLPSQTAALTDALLLERFVCQRDQTAFAVLVQRHARLVWLLCRTILKNAEDAEDAFQATFLVLARKAPTIRDRAALRSWLYGVSYRIATRAKAASKKRQRFEQPMPELEAHAGRAESETNREEIQVLLAEIERLPASYRLPVILHHLDGKTREETAQALGWTLGMVKGRLERARTLLRRRLERRGLVLSAGIPATLLASETLTAATPAGLARATIGMAKDCATAGAALGLVPPHVAVLAEGMVRSMMLGKVKTVLVLLFAFGLLGTGTVLVGLRPAAAEPAETADFLYVAEPENRMRDAQVVSQRDGLIAFIGTEIKPGEKVAPDRVVKVKYSGEIKEYRKLQEGDRVEAGQLVAGVDDRVARDEYAIKETQVRIAEANLAAAKAIADEADSQVQIAQKLHG